MAVESQTVKRARQRGAQASLTIMPTQDGQTLDAVDRTLSPQAKLVDAEGHTTSIPPEIHDILREVVEAMQAGRAIVLTPMTTRLTTGEAASYLGVSRPTLVKLLEEGKIGYDRPNRHRYVLLRDLEEYSRKQHEIAADALDSMIREADEAGLYDIEPKIFDEALAEVRGEE
jgi:DNA binding domain, excisionase family